MGSHHRPSCSLSVFCNTFSSSTVLPHHRVLQPSCRAQPAAPHLARSSTKPRSVFSYLRATSAPSAPPRYLLPLLFRLSTVDCQLSSKLLIRRRPINRRHLRLI